MSKIRHSFPDIPSLGGGSTLNHACFLFILIILQAFLTRSFMEQRNLHDPRPIHLDTEEKFSLETEGKKGRMNVRFYP